MAETFNPGDIVTLKSGGPPMTVSRIVGGDPDCEFFLFDDKGRFTERGRMSVPFEALKRWEAPRYDAWGQKIDGP